MVQYYECENCGAITGTAMHAHIASKMEYDSGFGNFTPRPRQLCCECYKAVGGTCTPTPEERSAMPW